eukprot:6007297-Amphidinium_carterae.1
MCRDATRGKVLCHLPYSGWMRRCRLVKRAKYGASDGGPPHLHGTDSVCESRAARPLSDPMEA